MNILLHYDAGATLVRRLQLLQAQGLSVEVCDERNDAKFYALAPTTEVLWHVLRPITGEMIARMPRLRLIQKIGIGVNTIDLDAAARRGIAVCNMPGTNSQAVAEMTLLLMLAVSRRLIVFDRRVRTGRGWDHEPALEDSLSELRGQRIGLVGFGAVPTLVAPWLKAMGADVAYCDVARKPDAVARFLRFDELIQTSDIISLHTPLTPETERMINRDTIARMKPGVILINTARGGLVDEAALIEALTSGAVAAAGLDVFAEEPIPSDHPFLKLENVVLAPHVSWPTQSTWERSLVVAIENCRRLTSAEPLLHQVGQPKSSPV